MGELDCKRTSLQLCFILCNLSCFILRNSTLGILLLEFQGAPTRWMYIVLISLQTSNYGQYSMDIISAVQVLHKLCKEGQGRVLYWSIKDHCSSLRNVTVLWASSNRNKMASRLEAKAAISYACFPKRKPHWGQFNISASVPLPQTSGGLSRVFAPGPGAMTITSCTGSLSPVLPPPHTLSCSILGQFRNKGRCVAQTVLPLLASARDDPPLSPPCSTSIAPGAFVPPTVKVQWPLPQSFPTILALLGGLLWPVSRAGYDWLRRHLTTKHARVMSCDSKQFQGSRSVKIAELVLCWLERRTGWKWQTGSPA